MRRSMDELWTFSAYHISVNREKVKTTGHFRVKNLSNLIRVLVLGAQTVERKGLSSLLNSLPSLTVVGEAANGQEALLMVHTSQPDIVLVEETIFQQEGPGPIWRIWQEAPGAAILVLCDGYVSAPSASDFDTGKLCFTNRDAAPEELRQVIRQVLGKQ